MSVKEIDGSLIRQLTSLGLEVENAQSFSDFDKFQLYKATILCVRLYFDQIKQELPSFPDILPKEMSGCFRICTALANIIKETGYKKELGFDQFLYPKERDTRDLLGYLIEKIQPKEDEKQGGIRKEENQSFKERVGNVFQFLAKTTWKQRTNINNFYKNPKTLETAPLKTIYHAKDEYEENYEKFLPFLPQQSKNLGPSIFEDNLAEITKTSQIEDEWNIQGIDSGLSKEEYFQKKKDDLFSSLKASILKEKNSISTTNNHEKVLQNFKKFEFKESEFTRRKQFETENEENVEISTQDAEEQEKKRQEEIQALTDSYEKLKRAIDKLTQGKSMIHSTINLTEESIQGEKQVKKNLEQDLKVLATSRKLYANKEENIQKMQQISAQTAQDLIDLAKEWESHRKGYIEKIRTFKSSQLEMKNNYKEKFEQMKTTKIQMEEMIQEIRKKDDLISKLKEEIGQLPKNLERKSFVDRIMDVNKNVEKQKSEINKILVDNKTLNIEIQRLDDSLTRTFIECENSIHQDTSKEESSKLLYKNIVHMREAFKDLIKMVESIGNMSNQIRDLETQIEHLTERNDGLNISKIESDLNEMKQENERIKNNK